MTSPPNCTVRRFGWRPWHSELLDDRHSVRHGEFRADGALDGADRRSVGASGYSDLSTIVDRRATANFAAAPSTNPNAIATMVAAHSGMSQSRPGIFHVVTNQAM